MVQFPCSVDIILHYLVDMSKKSLNDHTKHFPLPGTPTRVHILARYIGFTTKPLPYRPGDKKQLMYKDATSKLVRANILTKIPKTIYFVLRQRRNKKFSSSTSSSLLLLAVR